MEPALDTRIRAALNERRGEWGRIAERCEVSHSWISQFVRNKIPNPGYMTLRRLEADLFPGAQPPAAPGVMPLFDRRRSDRSNPIDSKES